MKYPMHALSAALMLAMGAAAQAAPYALTAVASANPKVPGMVQPNALSKELAQHIAATGAMALENGSALTKLYGYNDNGPLIPLAAAPGTEASKTEPDKNTYLVLTGQHGADAHYDYGTHFIFQGHETGTAGYITRVNLDADPAHRITLLADQDVNGLPLPTFDGSTWYPFSGKLLFTAEGSLGGGVWQADADYTGTSTAEGLTGILGQGGYEGIQADSDGNLWIVEDAGGSSGTANPHAKQPNSFVFRFVPTDKTNLKAGGVLQALQVVNAGHPVVFHPGQKDQDILSDDMLALHTYGKMFKTQWVTVHNTATDGTAPFNANAAAKLAGATPFKRPENGVFQPGTGFKHFYFTETGDTNQLTEAGENYGGFGGLFVLSQPDGPSANTGRLKLFYRGNAAHTGLDNITFLTKTQVVAVEDAGDALHVQRNALDSAYVFDTMVDYGTGADPVRVIAEGRDASATLDSAANDGKSQGIAAFAAFQNEGDNEITGIHVSDGDPDVDGILGVKPPMPFRQGWRFFWTQQHGDNTLWEVEPARPVAAYVK
ncbi:protein of unknown function [Methylomagnum ishizawai]|uniref:Phosphatase n=1 Tax=Methylomagnum ishizawai TaxID=1760988 RepID=A0A1Y6DAJ6_9GAMM|nr:alkaline phosphatase PhoX [Methylomagnum ishizawai]SMF97352.1 protein of unknown function [Methylomagnum ishizawai]